MGSSDIIFPTAREANELQNIRQKKYPLRLFFYLAFSERKQLFRREMEPRSKMPNEFNWLPLSLNGDAIGVKLFDCNHFTRKRDLIR